MGTRWITDPTGLQKRCARPRRQRLRSWRIASTAGMAPSRWGLLDRPDSTAGKWGRWCGAGGVRSGRGPRPPVARNKRAQPGEPLHLDTTTLVRFWNIGKRITRDDVRRSPRAGWQHVRVVVDRSRLADTEVRPTARRADAVVVLDRLLAWFRAPGITVQTVMTDIQAAY